MLHWIGWKPSAWLCCEPFQSKSGPDKCLYIGNIVRSKLRWMTTPWNLQSFLSMLRILIHVERSLFVYRLVLLKEIVGFRQNQRCQTVRRHFCTGSETIDISMDTAWLNCILVDTIVMIWTFLWSLSTSWWFQILSKMNQTSHENAQWNLKMNFNQIDWLTCDASCHAQRKTIWRDLSVKVRWKSTTNENLEALLRKKFRYN